jgi:hypothetical protein
MPSDLVRVELELPRDALRVETRAEFISQRNSLATTGIPPRLFLEMLRRSDFPIAIAREGKLRLVERDAFVAWLRGRSVAKAMPANDAAPDDLDDVDRAVLAAGGRVVR